MKKIDNMTFLNAELSHLEPLFVEKRYYYYGDCSGILVSVNGTNGNIRCLHCQTIYGHLPSINQLFRKKLMKTMKKDNYRRLYNHFKSTNFLEKS
jgi:hypothetical protein